jgi:hypothetical protein
MLSEALQRNAKPRKRGDFRPEKDALYAAKLEARLSNISDYAFEPRQQGSEILLPRLRDQDDRLGEA